MLMSEQGRAHDPKNHAAGRFLDLVRLTTAIEMPFANNLPPPLRKRRTSLATARLTSPFRLSLKATSFRTFLSCVTCADTRMLRHPQSRCRPLRPKTGHGLARSNKPELRMAKAGDGKVGLAIQRFVR